MGKTPRELYQELLMQIVVAGDVTESMFKTEATAALNYITVQADSLFAWAYPDIESPHLKRVFRTAFFIEVQQQFAKDMGVNEF